MKEQIIQTEPNQVNTERERYGRLGTVDARLVLEFRLEWINQSLITFWIFIMRNESRDMEAETMYLSNLFCS